MLAIRAAFSKLSTDPETKVAILTGTDPYYCAGVNLAGSFRPMHPQKLHDFILENNAAIFNAFLDFPKPILIAANGPAIGACVTSATTCDAILASEKATFLVPFARLSIPHDQLMEKAQEMAEDWVRVGKVKEIPAGGNVEEYKAVNAKESLDLADAFLSYPFLDAQYKFLKSKGKNATLFMILKTLRPLWSKLL